MAAMTPSTTISTIVFIMSSLVHSLLGRSVEAPVFEFFDDRVQVEGHADARRGSVVHADGVREPAGEQHALPGGGRECDALASVVARHPRGSNSRRSPPLLPSGAMSPTSA